MSSSPKVAILGSNGFLAKPVLDAFTTTFKEKVDFPILVITRSAKDKVSTDKIKYVELELIEENLEKLYKALEGIDVIIELTQVTPPIISIVEKVVSHVKPKLFIPSQFGTELDKTEEYLPGFLGIKDKHSETIRSFGVKSIDIITSLFATPGAFLYEIVGSVGVDAEAKTVQYRGDPDLKFPVSKLEDIGNVVAAIATNPNPTELPNKIRIYSDLVSQRQVVETYEKNHNVKLSEKETISAEESLKDAKQRYAKGFSFADFLFYLHTILALGEDKGLGFSSDERELINPKQSLWKWGKF
ncbi:hypothetical protein CAAN3_01S09186 [[Candida] anglica]